MELITKRTKATNIWIKEHVREGVDIVIATAYCNPDQKIIEKLRVARKTKFIVSGEFTINNPHLLQKLSKTMRVTIISPEANSGRLHAKVIMCRHTDGHRAALVGSANFTHQGLFNHDEAGIALDSSVEADRQIIDALERWIEELPEESPDWNRAFRIWDRSKKTHQFASTPSISNRCWVLKTTEGPNGASHWEDFKADGVLAIGWKDLKADPLHASKEKLKKELNNQEVSQIWDFVREWKPGDLVIICRGYAPIQDREVYLHGYAKVTQGIYHDPNPSWEWRLKWPAEIKVVERYLPKSLFVNSLGKGSLLRTVHSIGKGSFQKFTTNAEQEYGVPSPL